MKEMLKKIKADVLLSAVLCIVLGVVLLIYTQQATSIICKAIAIVLIVMGIGHVVTYFTNKSGSTARVAVGLVVLLLGIWIFCNPKIIINLIPAVIGIMLLVHGVSDLKLTMETKKGTDSSWISCLIFAIVNILIGIVLIVKAFDVAQIATQIVGIALIYDGISDFWIVSRATKAAKAVEQEMNAVDTEGKEL